MFSDEGRSVDQETLEYAWLLEIQLGRLTGKMTTPQVSLYTFLDLVLSYCGRYNSCKKLLLYF